MKSFDDLVMKNLAQARVKHPPYADYHHAYAILLEEVDEFWSEVKRQRHHRSLAAMLAELVDIATVARRTAEDMKLLVFADVGPVPSLGAPASDSLPVTYFNQTPFEP